MSTSDQLHPCISSALESLQQERISRRDFLRLATLLGASLATAQLLAGCTPSTLTEATAGTSAAIKRGGILRIGWLVGTEAEKDPEILRQIYEHLTWTDQDNITHPHLLQRWQVNKDLTEWTLHLHEGIKWTNGSDFISDDVVQSIVQRMIPWGLFEDYLTPDGVILVDERTVRLQLEKPKLDVPEVLYWSGAMITHRSESDSEPPSGRSNSTGPFILDKFEPDSLAHLVRRDGYWKDGEDGDSLPYLKEVHFIDLGPETAPYGEALFRGGELDATYPFGAGFVNMRDDPNYEIRPVLTNWTSVLRFHVKHEPWDDSRVRLAIKKLQDRTKILQRAYFGEGALGHDTHVSPAHPEFSPMEVPAYDPEEARALLQEAGIENLAFTIAVIDDPEPVRYAETLREDARAAGVEITVEKMTEEEYFAIWKSTPVGITNWHHRTLAVQVLPLAYTADDEGNPVPWNETGWVDEEFSALLAQAQLTRDPEARQAIMADLQRIQSERGSIGIAYWKSIWLVVNPAFRNLLPTPTGNFNLTETWYDPDLDPFA